MAHLRFLWTAVSTEDKLIVSDGHLIPLVATAACLKEAVIVAFSVTFFTLDYSHSLRNWQLANCAGWLRFFCCALIEWVVSAGGVFKFLSESSYVGFKHVEVSGESSASHLAVLFYALIVDHLLWNFIVLIFKYYYSHSIVRRSLSWKDGIHSKIRNAVNKIAQKTLN